MLVSGILSYASFTRLLAVLDTAVFIDFIATLGYIGRRSSATHHFVEGSIKLGEYFLRDFAGGTFDKIPINCRQLEC
jgi:hypothetical protein